ncbi:EAL domain-containing protein [Deferribacter autotrophicus]|uniref:EAL domain-containing protein n=1 Tax=Deferribacter autotrophicus TaxID=500465 RepID=A0A5A8F0R6_9BACT|nr:EAL domain-containing protein [Deferribacter autotrophicus]KAA0256850.1 EAL domain-containing protein [Deferribacter autotrophicus]
MINSSYSEVIEVIEQENIITVFQPIINIKEKKIVGVEALSRGIEPGTGKIISPMKLFNEAKVLGKSLEIDRICRKKAIESFIRLQHISNYILFMNIDSSILDRPNIIPGWTKRLAESAGIAFNSIAIEIVETRIRSIEKLIKFVEDCKNNGFLIVLDDFGANHSNLDRIVQVKPDIIKIDKELVKRVDKDYFKQSIINSIIHLSNKIGAITLAEGIETEEEVIKCYEMGISHFQGYYFSEPTNDVNNFEEHCLKKIEKTVNSINLYLQEKLFKNQQNKQKYLAMLEKILLKLKKAKPENFNQEIANIQKGLEDVECIYILNMDGIQISITTYDSNEIPQRKHKIFQPAKIGTDHSLKEYYYYLKKLGLPFYFSDEYISHATGNLCRTLSVVFKNKNSKHYILCVDFIVQEFKKAST